MFRLFKVAVCVLLTLVFTATSSFAQNGKALTLKDCIAIALKSNSQLKTAGYQLDGSGANLKGSYARILPRITASFSSGRFVQGDRTLVTDVPVAFDSTTGQTIFRQTEITQEGSSRNSHTARISYNQTLWDFGRSLNAIKQAKASFEASTHSLTSARHDVYTTVKQRYFGLLKAIHLEQEYRLAVDRSKEQLSKTQSMYEIGSVALIEVYMSERTLGQDEISLISHQTIVRIARGNLNVAMGHDPETPLDIADIDVATSPASIQLEEAIAVAEQNNPNLRRFENDMRSFEYGMKVAKSAYWPSLGVSVSYTRNNTEFENVYGNFNQNFSVVFGAQIDFNIFNGFADAAEVSRQSANYSIAHESWVDTKRRLHLEVKQAHLNLNAFHEISVINERNLRAGEEEYRLAQERYRVGAGTQLELTEAQVSLTRARVLLVRAKYDAMIAQAQLEAAMGKVEEE